MLCCPYCGSIAFEYIVEDSRVLGFGSELVDTFHCWDCNMSASIDLLFEESQHSDDDDEDVTGSTT